MGKLEGQKPLAFVSQSDRSKNEAVYTYPAAEFVLVQGADLHLWVNGVHFVEDASGSVQKDQYFLVHDPGMGVTISRIESVSQQDGEATVRHVFHWNEGELTVVDSTETWSQGEITGEFDRTMGDPSRSVFLQRIE